MVINKLVQLTRYKFNLYLQNAPLRDARLTINIK